MNQIAQTFGQRVRYYRKKRGFSQEKLAELCELHPTYIGQLERGEKNATLETVMSICRGLEIAPARLFENLSIQGDGGDYPSRAYDLFMRVPLEKQGALFELLEKAAALTQSL